MESFTVEDFMLYGDNDHDDFEDEDRDIDRLQKQYEDFSFGTALRLAQSMDAEGDFYLTLRMKFDSLTDNALDDELHADGTC